MRSRYQKVRLHVVTQLRTVSFVLQVLLQVLLHVTSYNFAAAASFSRRVVTGERAAANFSPLN
jgi:hypothetical protein